MQEPTKNAPVLIVLGHGKSESLCHVLVERAIEILEEKGIPYRLHDLLADGFDPVLRLRPGQDHTSRCGDEEESLLSRYQTDVIEARAYLVIHPVWWFAPPAILKGWVDRVLVDGVALDQPPEGTPKPLLNGRRALVVQTFNAPATVDKVIFSNITRQFWKRAVFFPVGIGDVRRLALYSVSELDESRFEKQLKRLRSAVLALVKGFET